MDEDAKRRLREAAESARARGSIEGDVPPPRSSASTTPTGPQTRSQTSSVPATGSIRSYAAAPNAPLPFAPPPTVGLQWVRCEHVDSSPDESQYPDLGSLIKAFPVDTRHRSTALTVFAVQSLKSDAFTRLRAFIVHQWSLSPTLDWTSPHITRVVVLLSEGRLKAFDAAFAELQRRQASLANKRNATSFWQIVRKTRDAK